MASPYGDNPNDPGAVSGLPPGAVQSPLNGAGYYIAWTNGPGSEIAEYERDERGNWRVRTVIKPWSVMGDGRQIGKIYADALGVDGGDDPADPGGTYKPPVIGGGDDGPVGDDPADPGGTYKLPVIGVDPITSPVGPPASNETLPTPTQIETPDPATGAWHPYQSQLPGQAWTRYLANLQGAPGQGTPGQGTGAYAALQNRGEFQQNLAPAFGYGIEESLGGQGLGSINYFNQKGTALPEYGKVQDAATRIMQALRETSPEQTQAAMDYDPAQSAGTDPALKPKLEHLMAGTYSGQDKQFDLVSANLLGRVNPFFQQGLSSQLGQQFRTQQAVSPGEQYLEYARRNGLI